MGGRLDTRGVKTVFLERTVAEVLRRSYANRTDDVRREMLSAVHAWIYEWDTPRVQYPSRVRYRSYTGSAAKNLPIDFLGEQPIFALT